MYSVAAGRRSSPSFPSAASPDGVTSKRSVRVPIHRHRPSMPAVAAMSGVTSTGTSARSSCSSVASSIIGSLNVSAMNGATSTSPSGWKRSTSSGPLATTSGTLGASGAGGNGDSSVSPTNGGRRLSTGRLKSTTSEPGTVHSGSRTMTAATSSAVSGVPSATASGSAFSETGVPSLSRNPSSDPLADSAPAAPSPPPVLPSPDAGTVAGVLSAPSTVVLGDVSPPPPLHAAIVMAVIASSAPQRVPRRVAFIAVPPPGGAAGGRHATTR